MAFTVEHAKRMRAAYQRAGKRTVQIGHQWTAPSGQITDAASFLKPELHGQDHRHPRATCTATRRTASRSGRGPSIPT